MLGKVIREPLLHFLLLGALIVAFSAEAPARLQVDERQVAARQQVLLGRAPTPLELETALQAEVDEALLVAEARRLGLERADPIIRRRLTQKMLFLLEDTIADPTDADLAEQLRPGDRVEGQIWFEHRYFLREASAEPTPFPHGDVIEGWRLDRVERIFGTRFDDVPIGEWHRRASKLGLHELRIRRRTPARPMTVDEARPRLTQRYRAQAKTASRARLLAKLQERFEIEVHR